jgi:hypothetical protein
MWRWKEGKSVEELSLYKFHKAACRNEGVLYMVRFRVKGSKRRRKMEFICGDGKVECGGILPIQISLNSMQE